MQANVEKYINAPLYSNPFNSVKRAVLILHISRVISGTQTDTVPIPAKTFLISIKKFYAIFQICIFNKSYKNNETLLNGKSANTPTKRKYCNIHAKIYLPKPPVRI